MLQSLEACNVFICNHDTRMKQQNSIFLVNIRPCFREGGDNDAVNIDLFSLEGSICDLKRNIVVDFLKIFLS